MIVPLIVMLILISILTITMVIGKGKPTEISQKLNEMIQKILPATGDVEATGIGENVIATFTLSTGEIHIYSTNPTTPGTIDRDLLWTFYEKCGAENIKSIIFDNEVYAPKYSNYLFRYKTYAISKIDLINLVTVNAQNLNTSKVIDMDGMFFGCSSLTEVKGINRWDTSEVIYMYNMFYGCSNLSSLEGINNWDIGNVTDLHGIFENCSNLTSIQTISGWNTSKVTDMSNMLSGCSNLTSIEGISNWNISNVTNLSGIFQNCETLTEINLSNWEKSNVTTISIMFSGCSNLSKIEGISEWNTINVTDMSNMFSGCASINSLDLSNWNVSNVTKMDSMFKDCTNITEVGQITNWETSNLTGVTYMFYGCTSLVEIDLSDWNMTKVAVVSHMFEKCSALKKVTLDNWDVQKVTIYEDWIKTGAPIDLIRANGWILSVKSVGMFSGTQVVKLEAYNWDCSAVNFFARAFYSCTLLVEIVGIETWKVTDFESIESMFESCTALVSVDLSGWKSNSNVKLDKSFWMCESLERGVVT